MSAYHKLSSASDDGEIYQEPSVNGCSCSHSSRQWRLLPWLWCSLCTVITVLAVVKSTLPQPACSATWDNNSRKYPTDFVSAPSVSYIPKYFYAYYDFNPANHMLEFNRSLVSNPDFKMYAGFPTREIDEAWDELLSGTWMALDESEVASVQAAAPWELEPLGQDDEVYMEVGVFHNLHCLNLVRQALDPEYYDLHNDFTSELEPIWEKVHIYHCVDQLRQALQCHSDLTPAPLFSVGGMQKETFLGHSVTHTCRDFDAVKRWRDERNKKRKPWSSVN